MQDTGRRTTGPQCVVSQRRQGKRQHGRKQQNRCRAACCMITIFIHYEIPDVFRFPKNYKLQAILWAYPAHFMAGKAITI
jgi:hypothetical protein